MRTIPRPPKLPEGYRLDLANEPDAPALRRPDGAFVARFSAKDMTVEAVERVALEDRLLAQARRLQAGSSVRSKALIDHD
jgi:hypothetical protein